MIVISTTTPQEFKVIPRTYAATRMTLTNETTREVTSYDITATIDGYYLTWTEAVTVTEDTFYNMTVYNGADIVYKDRVFCTNQTVSSYSVNNNEFTSVSSDNEYITV